MNNILTVLQGIKLFIYVNDIVVYANSISDYAEKLDKLLGRMRDLHYNLKNDIFSEKKYFIWDMLFLVKVLDRIQIN